MKKVTVSKKYVEGEWLLIETIDDLLEYVIVSSRMSYL